MSSCPEPLESAPSRPSNNRCKRRIVSAVVCVVIFSLASQIIRSARAADPQLTISLMPSNQVQLTITNAVAGTNYAIHRRLTFDDDDSWQIYLIADPGQTNFIADMGVDTQGFFRAIPCVDCDGDSVVDWADANPNDINIGVLWVTIDSPVSGENLTN